MYLKIILLFLILSSCTNSTGFKSEPKSGNYVFNKSTDPENIGLKRNGVALNFYNINKMNTALLPKFDDIKKKKIKI
tara:strand:+ start:151 stop:381 length:231 start_codon:yes stop_codon:yes gene_type:complete